MKTVALHSLVGTSKAKTAKAILFLDTRTNKEAWIPTSIASVKFIGPDYAVKVTVPDWFFNKISWKEPTTFVKKTTNPYVGMDVGNMMEERMVLAEMYDSLDETNSDDFKQQEEIQKRLHWIDEAVNIA